MSRYDGTVLVTGADGFIGSHLAEKLVRIGYRVRALVMYNSFGKWGWLETAPQEIRRELEVFPADIRDPHRVVKAVEGTQAVCHLASLIAIPYSYHSPDSYVQTNVQGTLNLLQAALKGGVERFVHTSTSEVYGSAQYVPMDEKHPVVGQSPYSATKIGADQLVESFFRSYGLPAVTLRPFNTYGPRQSARAIIPTIITQVAAGNEEIRLGSLQPTRDFTFVDDMTDGFVKALDCDRVLGEVINLGSGSEVSIGDLFSLITRVMDRQVKVALDPPRVRPEQSEVDRLLSDNRKAARMLDWKPLIDLEQGLARTVDWFNDPDNLAGYKPDQYLL